MQTKFASLVRQEELGLPNQIKLKNKDNISFNMA